MAYHQQQDQTRGVQPGDVLVVVHDFDARSTDELTLRRGERIELAELDEGFGDGWYLGKHLGSGGTGLFPGVYTTKVPTVVPTAQSFGYVKRTALPAQTASQQPQRPEQNLSSIHELPANPAGLEGEREAADENKQTASQSSHTIDHGSASRRTASLSSMQGGYPANYQRSIGQTLTDAHTGQDSPVMNETLSVIDEHITDLSTPRNSTAPQQLAVPNDSDSEYSSSHLDSRQSYLAGPETDDEENGRLTEAEVRAWDYKQTADHLRSLGVDSRHCDIFEEQEITGDVLLEMDQAFLYMKEYDFGVMGRRLKTWHQIRDFQNGVRGPRSASQTVAGNSSQNDSEGSTRAHSRLGSANAAMTSRIPGIKDEPEPSSGQSQQRSYTMTDLSSIPPPLQTQQNSFARHRAAAAAPPSPWRASMAPDSPLRPSAAVIRDMSHSRRHSSIDFDSHVTAPSSSQKATGAHRKNPSLDRGWSMTSAAVLSGGALTPTLRPGFMNDQKLDDSPDHTAGPDPSAVDLDRGYFSGNEAENRRSRNVLRKKDTMTSPAHSRQSSGMDAPKINTAMAKRQSGINSADSTRDFMLPITSTVKAAKAYHSRHYGGRFRSASARSSASSAATPRSGAVSPAVTNLESGFPASASVPLGGTSASRSPLNRGLTEMLFPEKARRVIGLRAISDTITPSEKAMRFTPSPSHPTAITEQQPVQSPTGSSTPSAASQSFEIDDNSSKGTDPASSLLSPRSSNRPRPKTKQQTSAYTRGLLNMSPAEARKTCDHSGWMKKKSSSLITTWKPRLFILRGRRLSYYYSEHDTVERGIIDISGHKVLVANQDPITTLHATITGAAASITLPPTGQEAIERPGSMSPTGARKTDGGGGPFYFKLVPPRSGMSRAVQFTKPTIHYFQCDNIVDGRKWMGEMMKATIEHDLSSFETTNKQKTISLKKAMERQERPPALKGTEGQTGEVANGENDDKENPTAKDDKEKGDDKGGLRISGLEFREGEMNGGSLGYDEKSGLVPAGGG